MGIQDNRAGRVGFLIEQLAEAKRELLEGGDFTPKERTYRIVAESGRATWYVESDGGENHDAVVVVQPAGESPFGARGSIVPLGEWTAVTDHLMRRIVLLRNSLRVTMGAAHADALARAAEETAAAVRVCEAEAELARVRVAAGLAPTADAEIPGDRDGLIVALGRTLRRKAALSFALREAMGMDHAGVTALIESPWTVQPGPFGQLVYARMDPAWPVDARNMQSVRVAGRWCLASNDQTLMLLPESLRLPGLLDPQAIRDAFERTGLNDRPHLPLNDD